MELAWILGASAAVILLGLPARFLGRRLYEAGIREAVKWKRDLGDAIYKHGFRLTVAVVVLIAVVLPRLLAGKGWFGGGA